MWLLEYTRLNDILQATSDYFMNVRANPELLIKLYEGINEFYRILRPVITQTQRKTKDAELKTIKADIFKEVKRINMVNTYGSQTGIKEEVLDAADEYYNSLMDLRQVCGLGIKVSREVSEKTRISRTVRGE